MYPAFNAPPDVDRLTTLHAQERRYCHNPVCTIFTRAYAVHVLYEHDTGAHYVGDPECPSCGRVGEREPPTEWPTYVDPYPPPHETSFLRGLP